MVRSILAGWVCILWGMWLGGLGALFLFAMRLFAVDRDLAVRAAPTIFLVFEKYQLLLAVLALVATAALRIITRSVRVTVVFWLLAAAAVAAAVEPVAITSRMQQLRQAGRVASPQFQQLHRAATILYSTETLILLAAGFVLPWSLTKPRMDMRGSDQ